jgi:hypothetical protein
VCVRLVLLRWEPPHPTIGLISDTMVFLSTMDLTISSDSIIWSQLPGPFNQIHHLLKTDFATIIQISLVWLYEMELQSMCVVGGTNIIQSHL